MAIPRGDCDCCGTLAPRLCEVEEGFWLCDDCAIQEG
jgi:hypothetical protein